MYGEFPPQYFVRAEQRAKLKIIIYLAIDFLFTTPELSARELKIKTLKTLLQLVSSMYEQLGGVRVGQLFVYVDRAFYHQKL